MAPAAAPATPADFPASRRRSGPGPRTPGPPGRRPAADPRGGDVPGDQLGLSRERRELRTGDGWHPASPARRRAISVAGVGRAEVGEVGQQVTVRLEAGRGDLAVGQPGKAQAVHVVGEDAAVGVGGRLGAACSGRRLLRRAAARRGDRVGPAGPEALPRRFPGPGHRRGPASCSSASTWASCSPGAATMRRRWRRWTRCWAWSRGTRTPR